MSNQQKPIKNIREELWSTYIQETEELLEKLEHELLTIEQDQDNPELISALFRTMHTLKGTSGMMGLNNIETLAHSAEDVMDKIREGELKMSNPLLDHLFNALDTFKEGRQWIIQQQSDEGFQVSEELITALKQYLTATVEKETSDEEMTAQSSPEQVPSDYFFDELWPLLSALRKTIEPIQKNDLNTEDAIEKIDKIKPPILNIQALSENFLEIDLLAHTTTLLKTLESDFTPETTTQLANEIQNFYTHCWDLEDQFERLTPVTSASFPEQSEQSEQERSQQTVPETHKVTETVVTDTLSDAIQSTTESGSKNATPDHPILHPSQSFSHEFTKELDALQETVGKIISIKSNITQLAKAIDSNELFQSIEKMMKRHNGHWHHAKPEIKTYLQQHDSDLKNLIQAQEDMNTVIDSLQAEVDQIWQAPINEAFTNIQSLFSRAKIGPIPLMITIQPPSKLQIHRNHLSSVIEVLSEIINVCLQASECDPSQDSLSIQLSCLDQGQCIHILGHFEHFHLPKSIAHRPINAADLQIDWQHSAECITGFDLKLPLETQVLEGIIAMLDDICYVFPVTFIQRIVNLKDTQYHPASASSQTELLKVNNEIIPLISLNQTINIRNGARQVVLIFTIQQKSFGIVVDELIGLQQVLVTPLQKLSTQDQTHQNKDIIQGCAILGQDTIGMVINPLRLVML